MAGLLALAAGARSAERRVADINAPPFASVGQINNEAYGRCTGVLIGRSRVVTAAHYLYNRRTKRFLPASSIHFVLGYDRGEYLFATVASTVTIGPAYDPSRPGRSLSSDWAILDLAEPAPESFEPLSLEAVASDENATNLSLAGFARDRPYVMTTMGPCDGSRSDGHLLVLSACKAPKGYSGGPVLDASGRSFVAIVVAQAKMDSRSVTLAVPTSAFAALADTSRQAR